MEKGSSGSVRIISVDWPAIERAIQEYIEALKGRPEVLRVVLFGSFATGRYAPGSDVDLLVVVSDSPVPFRQRIVDYLPHHFPVGVDVFPYTLSEVQQSPFAQEALREGEVMWERPGA